MGVPLPPPPTFTAPSACSPLSNTHFSVGCKLPELKEALSCSPLWSRASHGGQQPMASGGLAVGCRRIHQQRVTLTTCPLPHELPDCPRHPRPPCSVPRATAPGSHACHSLRSGMPRTISHPFPGESYLACQLAGPGVGPCHCLCVCRTLNRSRRSLVGKG